MPTFFIPRDELPDDLPDWLCREAPPEPIAEAVEGIPAGEDMVLDLGLGLVARPFDAKRD